MTIKETSAKWNLSVRRIQTLCNSGMVNGAVLFSGVWAIPQDAEKPIDHRIKSGNYIKENRDLIGPVLKWAGGKTQMIPSLMERIPAEYNNYIEPFVGGGALFFKLRKENSIISDSNPELINMYKQLANDCEGVIDYLKQYKNTEEMYYEERAKHWESLNCNEAAARTIYLNHTCFNGLYRLNKTGMFNTPFGRYKKPNICNEEKLRAVSKVLASSIIECGDYLSILEKYAKPGDFIFLDPPYIPISENASFKRYTKEQFYEQDHYNLASEVQLLVDRGCKVMLTNSNHPLVFELFKNFKIEVIQTKRNINSNGSKRNGEDVIVTTY